MFLVHTFGAGSGVEGGAGDGAMRCQPERTVLDDKLCAAVGALAERMESEYHRRLLAALRRLSAQINETASKSRSANDDLAAVLRAFQCYCAQLQMRLLNAGRVLFPRCRKIAAAKEMSEPERQEIDHLLRVLPDMDRQAIADFRNLLAAARRVREPDAAYRSWLADLEELHATTVLSLMAESTDLHRLLNSAGIEVPAAELSSLQPETTDEETSRSCSFDWHALARQLDEQRAARLEKRRWWQANWPQRIFGRSNPGASRTTTQAA